jgi:hypothetical protein
MPNARAAPSVAREISLVRNGLLLWIIPITPQITRLNASLIGRRPKTFLPASGEETPPLQPFHR